MAVESAKQDVQVSVGKDFVIMGTDRVEVSPDGKKVTAWTNDGVETKAGSGAATQGISISADFNTVVLNGATIERAADGHLVISTPGTVITKPGPANDSAAKAKVAIAIGDEMEDGTIYAGISPDTHKPMYATPRDASGVYDFNQAAKYAKNLDANGNHDFHVPTKGELNVLFENRDKGKLKGTFNETGSGPAGWYWSSSPGNSIAWAQRFSYGLQLNLSRDNGSSLRCVR
jgi:Protein of unknown function (DUF1566)